MNSLLSPIATKGNTISPKGTYLVNNTLEVRQKINAAKRDTTWKEDAAEAIINNAKAYNESLKQKRLASNKTATDLQKKKYHYRNMSMNIIRSKTSTAAKQIVSQTKREIERLKKAKSSGKYDNEEIDAAIAHAKSMERIARKKARHLEAEEMAKASGQGKLEKYLEKVEEKSQFEETEEAEKSRAEGDFYDDNDSQNGETPSLENIDWNNLDYNSIDYETLSDDLESMSREMLESITESMDDLLKDMGLEELSESLLAATGKMDENDIKMMEIKHRNDEMKDIVKANAEYLKSLFEHYENMKNALPGSNGATLGDTSGFNGIDISSGLELADFAPSSDIGASIDVAL